MTVKRQRKPGPAPDVLVIEGEPWGKAIKKAMDKKRPTEGWPDRQTKKRKSRKAK